MLEIIKRVKRLKKKIVHPRLPDHLRVVTFNVHFAKYPDKLIKAIKNNEHLAEADLFLFQEIEAYPKEGQERAAIIAEALGMNYSYAPARAKKDGTHGLATLSRHHISHSHVVSLPYFKLRARIALNTTIKIEDETILVSNVHLDTRLNSKQRITQMDAVIKELKKESVAKVIIGGDLNTIPLYWLWGRIPIFYTNTRKKIHKHLEEAGFLSTKTKLGHTYRNFVRFKLDAIYASSLEMTNSGVEKGIKVSDHRPLWADLKLG